MFSLHLHNLSEIDPGEKLIAVLNMARTRNIYGEWGLRTAAAVRGK